MPVLKWISAAVTIAAIAAGCGPATTGSGGPVTGPKDGGGSGGSGEVADFVLKDVDGRAHALTDYLGKKVILISFWATWCEPCKKEMDQLQTLYEVHASAGLMILSISMDEPETQGDVRPFVKQRVDRGEKTSWTHEGYVPGDEKKVEAAVLEALGKSAQ
jgi:thiol-disulfide isomerase/thioredoxin